MPAGNEMKKKKNNNNNNDNECGEAVKVWRSQSKRRGKLVAARPKKIGVFPCVSHETDPNPFCCAITKWARPM